MLTFYPNINILPQLYNLSINKAVKQQYHKKHKDISKRDNLLRLWLELIAFNK